VSLPGPAAIGRRDALKRIGIALGVPALSHLSADALLALGRGLHERISEEAGRHVFRTLDAHQGRTVRVLVDRILPETDSPGALAVRADEFIDLMLAEVLPTEDRDRFLAGLARLDEASRSRFGRDFASIEPEQQVRLMESQEEEAAASARDAPAKMSWGRPEPPRAHFFHQLKHLTLLAYYTSEPGLVGELGFVMIPGSYPGCPRR
jgi:hypothetical protein